MNIQITNKAKDMLNELGLKSEKNILLLEYETDGCGCVVNGVSQLVELPEIELTDQDLIIETTPAPFRVAIKKRVEWIYDNNLKIDFSDGANMFQLKSLNEMLNPRMTFKPSAI
ncbi:heme biosynthesis protein HemY [Salipaludibacillus keqinensis]|uniref:Heme biosynthesis protein HemY n=1 Tax=Salipaludibacillus keqinensis TaxID=2045207 RepID=A0A323TGN1_9BACI|nr:iron-sulfur cluster biosynthesis family protein [Salipaludibacillus keqinensis]PYZ94292.1 heme biosynthesis protein HemY [Salipaludibacillus keqinensis]